MKQVKSYAKLEKTALFIKFNHIYSKNNFTCAPLNCEFIKLKNILHEFSCTKPEISFYGNYMSFNDLSQVRKPMWKSDVKYCDCVYPAFR